MWMCVWLRRVVESAGSSSGGHVLSPTAFLQAKCREGARAEACVVLWPRGPRVPRDFAFLRREIAAEEDACWETLGVPVSERGSPRVCLRFEMGWNGMSFPTEDWTCFLSDAVRIFEGLGRGLGGAFSSERGDSVLFWCGLVSVCCRICVFAGTEQLRSSKMRGGRHGVGVRAYFLFFYTCSRAGRFVSLDLFFTPYRRDVSLRNVHR